MGEKESDEITHLLNQLYSTEREGAIYHPNADTRREVFSALLAIAQKSPEARSQVIRALIQLLEQDADGGANTAFFLACDLLGELKALEAIETLVRYIDYEPGRISTSLHYMPAVRALIEMGKAAVPKLAEALVSGKSVLRANDHTLRYYAGNALLHIGGTQAKEALEMAYSQSTEEEREWLRFAIEEIERGEAERQSGVTRVRIGKRE
ncbi:MAG TPA: hypothetical protein VJ843_00010 [Candidatus Saccharimonadales bacterium]|nr:hypothetical protein [Candidatus Saccharimonadales bacterium]